MHQRGWPLRLLTNEALSALLFFLSACGGRQTNDPEMGGAPGVGDHAGGTGGTGGPGVAEPALPAGAGSGGDDDGGGQAGAGGTGGDPEETVTDVARLGGKSFTLTGSLCPQLPMDEDVYAGPPSSMLGFHVRVTASGALEAVTFTRTRQPVEALPDVHVAALESSGTGFDMRDVPTCARERYQLENEFVNEPFLSKRVHVAFVSEADGTLSAVLRAKARDGALLESRAVADSNGPELFVVDNTDQDYISSVDGTLDRFFVLSEPADPASTFSVKDASGNAVPAKIVETIVASGFPVGFHVREPLSAGASLRARLRDLAGNASVIEQGYPGITLKPVTGDFEGSTDFFTSDIWNDGVSEYGCEVGVSRDLGPGDLVSFEGSVPPIAGKQSMFVFSEARCRAFLRIRRSAGATKLLLDARAIVATSPAGTSVDLQLRSLDSASEESKVTLRPSWEKDEELSTERDWISAVEMLSIDLPTSGDDLLFELQPTDGMALWLDSLRFE